MAKLNITVKGADKIVKKLSKISKDAERDVLGITQATALEITRDAKTLAPVDLGKLRQSIANRRNGSEISYSVFTNSPYAPYQEFGTGNLTSVPPELKELAIRFKRGGSRNLRPQPFMWPAFIKNKSQYIKDLKQLLKKYKL